MVIKLSLHDSRSKSIVFLADYFINSQKYPTLRSPDKAYEFLVASGVGLVKFPPLETPDQSLEAWIRIIADMIEEYTNHQYRVCLLGVADLEGCGIWIKRITEELRSRGITEPLILCPTSMQVSETVDFEHELGLRVS
jgi:hypothetical protein